MEHQADRFDELLSDAAHSAWRAYRHAMATMSAEDRRRTVGEGADGTATHLLSAIVERAVLDVLGRFNVNVLSEEIGWIDNGSAVTVVLDPVDGSANAIAGIPVCGFAAAVVVDDQVQQSRILWFETGREVLTFQEHSSFVWAVAFSPNGEHIASAGDEGLIRRHRPRVKIQVGKLPTITLP